VLQLGKITEVISNRLTVTVADPGGGGVQLQPIDGVKICIVFDVLNSAVAKSVAILLREILMHRLKFPKSNIFFFHIHI